MIVQTLDISAQDFAAGTGWEIKPEGACKADVCVPLGSGPFDARATAERLRMAVVHDPKAGVYAIGPESLGDRALVSALAPELELNDVNGNPFRLSALLGKKVVIVSWAPY
jgi:tetrahydromethanopterin S-methyltransferase subunit H